MGFDAKPITWLYLLTGSPGAIARTPSLCPAGIGFIVRTPTPSNQVPDSIGLIATTTSSTACNRITRGSSFIIFKTLTRIDDGANEAKHQGGGEAPETG